MIVSSRFFSAAVNDFLSASEHAATVEFIISSAIVATLGSLKLTENTARNADTVSPKSEQDHDDLDKSGLLFDTCLPFSTIVSFGFTLLAFSTFCLAIVIPMITLAGSLIQIPTTSPTVSSYLRHFPKAAMHLVLYCTNFLRYSFDTGKKPK